MVLAVVGIAGSLSKDAALGDVVVPTVTDLYGHEAAVTAFAECPYRSVTVGTTTSPSAASLLRDPAIPTTASTIDAAGRDQSFGHHRRVLLTRIAHNRGQDRVPAGVDSS